MYSLISLLATTLLSTIFVTTYASPGGFLSRPSKSSAPEKMQKYVLRQKDKAHTEASREFDNKQKAEELGRKITAAPKAGEPKLSRAAKKQLGEQQAVHTDAAGWHRERKYHYQGKARTWTDEVMKKYPPGRDSLLNVPPGHGVATGRVEGAKTGALDGSDGGNMGLKGQHGGSSLGLNAWIGERSSPQAGTSASHYLQGGEATDSEGNFGKPPRPARFKDEDEYHERAVHGGVMGYMPVDYHYTPRKS